MHLKTFMSCGNTDKTFAVSVFSSVCNIMQSSPFNLNFFRIRMNYPIPYDISEIEQMEKGKKEDATSNQLLPDITFYVYQFTFMIRIISICINMYIEIL